MLPKKLEYSIYSSTPSRPKVYQLDWTSSANQSIAAMSRFAECSQPAHM